MLSTSRTAVAAAGFGAALLLLGGLAVAEDRLDTSRAADVASAPTSPPPVAQGQVACPDGTRSDIAAQVQAQLDDFARDDWAAALDHATAGFRSTIDAGMLADIIEGAYPVAAQAVSSEVGECAVVGPDAQALVRVLDDAGREELLVYLLSFEDGQWRIAGAGTPPGQRDTPAV